jgi:nucleoid-associated protein YgaU
MAHTLYVVQPRDYFEGLIAVARKLYGDETRWPQIYEANRAIIGHNPAVLSPGQQLIVPIDAAMIAGDARFYVVHATGGNCREELNELARRFYGDADRWPEIYQANRGVIGDDPRQLQAGQRLFIP